MESAQMSEEKTLSIKQAAAIRALLVNPNVASAATAAGVAERTVYRWMDEPAFRSALASAQDEALDAATRNLVALTGSAITVIQTVLDAPVEKTSNKLRAATVVLDNVLKLVELRDLAQRVAALENDDED